MLLLFCGNCDMFEYLEKKKKKFYFKKMNTEIFIIISTKYYICNYCNMIIRENYVKSALF